MLAAHVDHGLCAAERQAEIDLDRRRALRNRTLGEPSCLVGVARHDRIVGIGGPFAVDVGAGCVDARPAQPVGRDHRPQPGEVLVPLAGVAKGRDAVGELPQGQLRIRRPVLDVEVHVHQARQHRAARQVHALRAGGNRHGRRRADGADALAFDDDAGVFDGGPAGAVDQPRVLEHENASRRLGGDDGNEDEQGQLRMSAQCTAGRLQVEPGTADAIPQQPNAWRSLSAYGNAGFAKSGTGSFHR